jgi:hypothetical protein
VARIEPGAGGGVSALRQIIGGRPYPSKEAVRERCRGIISRGVGAVEDMYDFAFLCDLFGRHPHAEQKVGEGIASIVVRHVPPYNQPGFYLRRLDGSETDISFLQCVAARTDMTTLYGALRRAVDDQIIEFKTQAFKGRFAIECPYTAELVFRTSCHVDHQPPKTFQAVADRWITLAGGRDRVRVASGDGDIGSRLLDVGQLESWRSYHRTNAELRIVSVEANLVHIPAESRAAA